MKEEIEVWVDIEGHPKYEVSNLGRLRNKKTGTIRRTNARGKVRIDGVELYLHRLVAIYFVPHESDHCLCRVMHKDGNRLNNRADNLWWEEL